MARETHTGQPYSELILPLQGLISVALKDLRGSGVVVSISGIYVQTIYIESPDTLRHYFLWETGVERIGIFHRRIVSCGDLHSGLWISGFRRTNEESEKFFDLLLPRDPWFINNDTLHGSLMKYTPEDLRQVTEDLRHEHPRSS